MWSCAQRTCLKSSLWMHITNRVLFPFGAVHLHFDTRTEPRRPSDQTDGEGSAHWSSGCGVVGDVSLTLQWRRTAARGARRAGTGRGCRRMRTRRASSPARRPPRPPPAPRSGSCHRFRPIRYTRNPQSATHEIALFYTRTD